MASENDSFLSSHDVSLQQNFEELEDLCIEPIGDCDKFRSFIDLGQLNSEILKAGTLFGLNRYITNLSKSFKDKKLTIGVAGYTGTGKSSLINALRRLKSQDKRAARVGITETTTTVQEYPYPGNARIVLIDFPGVGSRSFPKEHYLKETKLLDSDVVIVVSSGRFTETDLWIAKEVIKKQRDVLFVRTKVDTDIENSSRDYPKEFSESECLRKIRDDMEIYIKQENLDIQFFRHFVYLVSSPKKDEYDFDNLVKTIQSFSDKESNAICQLLYEHMKKTIESKTKETEKEFLGRKIWSAIIGFLPIPLLESAMDTYHVGEMIKECKKKYFIDDESLEELAYELNTSKYSLKNMLQSKSSREASSEGEKLHSVTEDKKWGFYQKYSKYVLPVVGSLFSAYKSPCTIQECLEQICSVMANDELMLVSLRLEKLRQDLNNMKKRKACKQE